MNRSNKCIVCGKEKPTHNPNILYCSEKCRKKDLTRICPVCNKKFQVEKRSVKTIHCSKKCAMQRNKNSSPNKKDRPKKYNVHCTLCNKEFTVTRYKYMNSNNFFCCREHYLEFAKKGTERIKCRNCGKEIEFTIKSSTKKFCCDKCRIDYNFKKHWEICTCKNCGKKFKRRKSDDKGQTKTFCTMKCYSEYRIGGISRLDRNNNDYQTFRSVLDHTPEIKKWRKEVLNKYNNKCALCSSTNKLTAHHIISAYKIIKDTIGDKYNDESIEIMKNNELYNNVNNGIALCDKHHGLCHDIRIVY